MIFGVFGWVDFKEEKLVRLKCFLPRSTKMLSPPNLGRKQKREEQLQSNDGTTPPFTFFSQVCYSTFLLLSFFFYFFILFYFITFLVWCLVLFRVFYLSLSLSLSHSLSCLDLTRCNLIFFFFFIGNDFSFLINLGDFSFLIGHHFFFNKGI